MKISKLLVLILTICAAFLLFACDYEFYLYHENIRENTEVVQIDLVNYTNPISEENQSENTLYDVEKLEVLETLNLDDYEIFLSELSEIGGLSGKFPETVSSPNGTGILITYQDGGVTLITVSVVNDIDCIFVGHYDANASIEGFYGISWQDVIDNFCALILEYFDTEID